MQCLREPLMMNNPNSKRCYCKALQYMICFVQLNDEKTHRFLKVFKIFVNRKIK